MTSETSAETAVARRKKDLARIHILKTALSIDQATYEDVLWEHCKVTSSAALDAAGRKTVIDHLEQLLRRANPTHRALGRVKRRPHNTDVDSRSQLKKIEALLTDAGLPWAYAESILARQTGGHYTRCALADRASLTGVIAALERAAIKRLHHELEAVFGSRWIEHAEGIAAALFSLPSSFRVDRSTADMSKVLRWWRGELSAACKWPVTAATRGDECCSGCGGRAVVRGVVRNG